MFNSRATQKDWPGAMALTSLTRRAFTLSVATVLPETAKAGEASSRQSSPNFTVRMNVCYPINSDETLAASAGCAASHNMARTYRSVDA